MKYLGNISDPKDLVTKEYVDDHSGGGAVSGVKGDSESTYRTGNVNLTAANIGAVADCTLSIRAWTSGNPRVVKFCTVNYDGTDSNNGVFIKISMRSGHGNGTSYNIWQDAVLSVGYQGSVTVNVFRYYADSITYESVAHNYGDILYTVDTTNKVVKFYVLMGQYSYLYQSPLLRLNASTAGTITQHTGDAIMDMSGTHTYANVFWLDGSTKQDKLVSGTNIKTINSNSLLGSGNVALTASDVGALPISGGTMTGTLGFTENSVEANFRPANASYYSTISHQTAGNETTVFATKNEVTSFMFVNGEDSVTNHASNRWQSLTPALQIKNNKVAIGKLIANNVTPTYALDVNGTVNATSFEGSGSNLAGVVHTETDPTVPSWAKASSKPSYTASEVGAVPTTRTVNGTALSSDITLTAADVGAQSSTVSTVPLTVASDFSLYTTGEDITLKRAGKFVELSGKVKPKSNISGSATEYKICTVPTGYRPSSEIDLIMPGSTQYKWLLRIYPAGSVTFSRYSASTSYAQASTSTWLPFHATWILG